MREAAQVLRDELGSKRSDKLLRLFDFLLERTIDLRPPTELEITNEIFSTGRTLDAPQDATVRVYIHRLRKLMDEVYKDRPDPGLMIPLGQYSVQLTGVAETVVPKVAPAEQVPLGRARSVPRSRLALGAACLVALLAILFLFPAVQDRPTWPAIWRPLAKSDRPITIVMGDYFLFGQMGSQGPTSTAVPRLVWDHSILTRDDLDIYLMRHPEEGERITPPREQYVSSSTIMALEKVQAILRDLTRGQARPIKLISASQLVPDAFKSSDVVYVGLLSGLSVLLCDPLFQASGFTLGDTFNDLTDAATGTKYQSDGVVLTEERIPRVDYGYMASLPGPAGNTIMIIAGTRDPGLLEMAELAGEPARIAAAGFNGNVSFRGLEMLYRVRAMANLNIGATLVLHRELRSQGIWDKSATADGTPSPSDTPAAAPIPH
ncbi:hypothetical protein [Nitrospirillum viridazoti]|uniref:Uncharacterized protein n=1 Tax=Nitrospirillum viridazoti CBAmc TaxID=1441467 RepID=A0A248JUV3_9PROT|nr:hypothetical protein [Nitrospirillum amazonense]ASG22300.1 hypothetical protein Y958_15175 [Nitrospirillum amazonense CBAmc]TWB43176.1 hypothetical protein FBZ91_102393 [Nitrospirillum amazonense]